MKNLILFSVLILVIALSACIQTTETQGVVKIHKTISVAESLAMIESNKDNPDFVIIDVRTADEFAEGRLEGSINIDYNRGDFITLINELDKKKIYLIYCRSGRRSAGAFTTMIQNQFQTVYQMDGGIVAWEDRGYKTVR